MEAPGTAPISKPSETLGARRKPEPFSILVPESVLEDLRKRLAQTRWPDEIQGEAWQFGTDLRYLEELCDYWRQGYEWRKHEAELNRLKHFVVELDQTRLHYICEQGEGPNPRPLLLTHGWPGSFFEYHKLIPRLTRPSEFGGRPEDAFTVVVPSMPGHGFSFEANQPRFGIKEIADSLKSLMVDVLGYSTFSAHGHDWGAFVATRLGYAHAQHLDGIHITLLATPRKLSTVPPRTPEEQKYYQHLDRWLGEETGYSQIMGTKPQALAFALTDSPIGLAAWIVEKFRSWSDCGGDLDKHFGRDVLLTNIMIYWVTGAIGSTFWPYYARLHSSPIIPEGERVQIPVGYAEHPREILTPPHSLADEVYADIRRWTRMKKGGHFPALEAPDELVAEIRTFFASLR